MSENPKVIITERVSTSAEIRAAREDTRRQRATNILIPAVDEKGNPVDEFGRTLDLNPPDEK